MAYPNESSQLVLYALHDFETSPQDASTACAFLDDDIKLAAAQPFKYIVLVAGDLNRPYNDLGTYSYGWSVDAS